MIVHMIGNAHIDPIWLWRWQAGVDEALATFRSAADLCDAYPDFIFTRGESWLYRHVEQLDPPLFERVRRLIARGQWHVTGGQVVQPDANLPTAMGWRRQILHGQRYFQERFGVRPTIGYNVDTFGHPATLPDLLSAFGYIGYVFHRPGPHQVQLPAQTFRWRGVDDHELLAFRIVPVYVTHTDDLYAQIMIAAEATNEALGHTMCFYGVGNHGGGPSRANIEYILANAHAIPGLELRFSTPLAFFEAVAAQREQLPIVREELQHTFPGCYSVMHDIKQTQRAAEHQLDQCERVIEQLAPAGDEQTTLHARLDAAWDDLLFTAFHDVLSGTAIASAYEAVRSMHGRARITGEEIVMEATRRWVRRSLPPRAQQQLVIVNPDAAPWHGFVEAEPHLDFDAWRNRWLSDEQGQPIAFQPVQPEAYQLIERVLFPLDIAPRSYACILVRDDPPPAPAPVASDLVVSATRLANSRLQLDLAPGGVAGLAVDGRSLLGDGGLGLHLRQDHTDTWTFHADQFREPISTTFSGDGWQVEETGPLRARVRLEGQLGRSQVSWTLTLYRGEPWLHMHLEINFGERQQLLQMPITLAQTPHTWLDGQPGGHVARRPGPTEWPVQGWSRVALDGIQLAVVTQDAYSVSLEDTGWQWSLLRSPMAAWGGGYPDVYSGHDRYTDQGVQRFTILLTGGAELPVEELERAGRQLAQPPIVLDWYEGMRRPSWGNNPPPRLWGEAVQRARAEGRLPHLVDEGEKPVFSG